MPRAFSVSWLVWEDIFNQVVVSLAGHIEMSYGKASDRKHLPLRTTEVVNNTDGQILVRRESGK